MSVHLFAKNNVEQDIGNTGTPFIVFLHHWANFFVCSEWEQSLWYNIELI